MRLRAQDVAGYVLQPEVKTTDSNRAYEMALKELAQIILSEPRLTAKKFIQYQKVISKRYGLNKLIGLRELLNTLPQDDLKRLSGLKIKPVRTASGIVVVAVMAAPHPCPGRMRVTDNNSPQRRHASPHALAHSIMAGA
ncbi:MAG: hypothetical protein ACK4TI_04935 [Nitrososphaerales archaeon]